MRAEVVTGPDWANEFEAGDAERGVRPMIVTFVDQRGRTSRVAFGRRMRRYAGSDSLPVARPVMDPDYCVLTIQ